MDRRAKSSDQDRRHKNVMDRHAAMHAKAEAEAQARREHRARMVEAMRAKHGW